MARGQWPQNTDDVFIYDVLKRAAARWPEAIAASDDRQEQTFAELHATVVGLARGLTELGLRPGDRVIDLQANSLEYLTTDLAIPSAGLVRVAVNHRLSDAELEFIVNDSGARAIIYSSEFQAKAAHLLHRCEHLEIAVGAGDDSWGQSLAGLVSSAETGHELHPPADPATLVSLNYSSGTTGRPKGCMRTARNRYVSTSDILNNVFGGTLGDGDVMLHAGPITHASGLLVLPCIAVGARQHLLRSFEAPEVLRHLRTGAATVTVLVPTMVERVMAATEDDAPAFETLRSVLYAGAPMTPDRIKAARRFFDGKIAQFYGMVEAIPPLTVLDIQDHADDGALSSAGRPANGVHIQVVDDDGTPCGPGELGEVLIGGDHVMAGYWGAPALDGKTRLRGMLRSGDIGRFDERGLLHLVDRRGDMIITGGYNVYPREVEDTIRESGLVADVVVVGVPHPDWGQTVTAFVVPDGEQLETASLHSWCASRLASFKKPKQFLVVDDFPKTTIGKIDRKELAARAAAGAH